VRGGVIIKDALGDWGWRFGVRGDNKGCFGGLGMEVWGEG
jgi:hypothetical protein